MNCYEFEQYLDQYLDGDFKGSLKLEFEAHVVDCEPCGHLFGMMEAMGEIITARSPREPVLSVDFSDRVMSGLAASKRKVKIYRWINRWSAAAAILVIAASGIIFSAGHLVNSPESNPVLFAESGPQQIDVWLADTLEQAGSSLYDLRDLRTSAVDQMRRGLFKSLSGTMQVSEYADQDDHQSAGLELL